MKVARILKLRDDIDIVYHNLIYYHNIGVDETFIMLHEPSTHLLNVLDLFKKENPHIKLTLLWHNKEGLGANPVNHEYLQILTDAAQKAGYSWIIGSDADEFLILKKCRTIQEFLYQYDHNPIISLLFPWVNFYIHKNIETLKFYDKMTKRRKEPLGWTKSIGKFDSSMYFVQGLHHIGNDVFGQVKPPLSQIKISENIAYYAHFPYRSKEQFIHKNKIQAHKFKDWRYKKLQKDPLFFDKYFDMLLENNYCIWPKNLDKESSEKNHNDFIVQKVENTHLMERMT